MGSTPTFPTWRIMMKPIDIKKALKKIQKNRKILDREESQIRKQCEHQFVKVDWSYVHQTTIYECKVCGESKRSS